MSPAMTTRQWLPTKAEFFDHIVKETKLILTIFEQPTYKHDLTACCHILDPLLEYEPPTPETD